MLTAHQEAGLQRQDDLDLYNVFDEEPASSKLFRITKELDQITQDLQELER